MFIDKLYRLYSPYDKQSKQSTTQSKCLKASLNLNSEDNWDTLNYTITNAKDGTDLTDVSNMQQTLVININYF